MLQSGLSFCLFVLPELPGWNRFELFPFLVHCCFRLRNFHRLRHRNKLANHIVMWHRSNPFACHVVFKIFSLRRFRSLPSGFMRFHDAFMNRFWSLFGCNLQLRNHFRDAIWRSFTRHAWCHRSFQFSPRIFEDFFVCFVIQIDKVNSSQFASVVEFWFFLCPPLFF